MTLRVVSWNINSVRLRIAALERLVAFCNPDVLCLQETKVVDESFPLAPLAALGYRHTLIHGMKSYNGVAILPGNIELHNLYIPAGGDVPDPAANRKFAHKLQFLDEMTQWFANGGRRADKAILVGDLNVAPLETDVWSHRQLLKVVSHTPIEVARLAKLQASRRWVDAIRHFIPPERTLFSWWSYRARDWAASDRGRRLDHVWVTPALA